MYIKTLKIKGYRTFQSEFTVTLNKGLNIFVGENASGKSTIIDAIRLLLVEDEYGRSGIDNTDFHRPIANPANSQGSDRISIKCEFSDLTDEQQVAYLPWLDIHNPKKATLNLAVENKEDNRGRFKRKLWGNESEVGLFEWELLNRIHCVYLPALRDAEDKLRAFKGSRIARLLKNLKKDTEEAQHPLEKKLAAVNKELLRDDSINQANKFIRENVIQSIGEVFGQDVSLQFSEVNFDRIVERIRLLFYPNIPKPGEANDHTMFRSLDENSLGFNNILYLATILAEFDGLSSSGSFHKVLLIEEPEAHLHPQLQMRLMQYLENKSKEENIQIIITTHSPTLSSTIDLHNIKVLSLIRSETSPVFTDLSKCQIGYSKNFIERWLDITKSVLLFAKGILFVEGIAEALIIKELAVLVLNQFSKENSDVTYQGSLDDYGVSIINLNGIYFEHFFTLFKGYHYIENEYVQCDGIPIRCAGITDNDPPKDSKPTPSNPVSGGNNQLYLIDELIQQSKNCRLFKNLKTFEYDLALEGNNLALMSATYLEMVTTDGSIRETATIYSSIFWPDKGEDEKAAAAYWLLTHIESKKGEYAQRLASNIAKNTSFTTPSYIIEAIRWVIH